MQTRNPITFAFPILTVAIAAVLFGLPQISRAESGEQQQARLEWWRAGRIGLFIHWGPVSLKGTEISWSRANSNPKCPNQGTIPVEVYDNLYREFNPTNFNAAEWAAVAKRAGVKYVVLTAKHCDGFLLWHSKADDYHIGRTPFRQDVCRELAEAVRHEGLRIGWYFSPMDWRDPDFRTERNGAFLGRMQAELRELLSNYGRIDLLWFDWDGREPLYDQAQTYAIPKSLQPNIIINNRLDLARTNSNRQILSPNADYYTPEQELGSYDDQQPWESCMTLGTQWAWKPGDRIKTLAETIRILVNCAGGDGNLLLNVGPMPDGRIEPRQVAVLDGLGKWLGKYGQSIYGTRGGPFKPGEYGTSTRAGKTIYLHITDWTDERIKLPLIPAKVVASRTLTGGTVELRKTPSSLEITLPQGDRDPIDTIVALDLDTEASRIPAVAVPRTPSLTTNGRATASNVHQKQAQYAPGKAVDGQSETRWATDSGVKSAWLEVDLGQPKTFGRAVVNQAYPELDRVRKFAIEYWQDEQWKTCYAGGKLGAKLGAKFPPVTAQRVRLNIIESTDGPTINEFDLFPPEKR